MARAGLDAWGVDADERDHLLGIIEQRCLTGQNGASWFADRFHRVYDEGRGDRMEAVRVVLVDYLAHMHSNEPVHTWA
jgi:hypothetical protein